MSGIDTWQARRETGRQERLIRAYYHRELPRPQQQRQQTRAVCYNPSMPTAKDQVRKLLDTIPDNASFEDIQYHIYVRQKIAAGLADVEAGRGVTPGGGARRMGPRGEFTWAEERLAAARRAA